MKQLHLNIIFGIGIFLCGWLSLRHEKTPTQTQPINYELLQHRFDEINTRIEALDSQSIVQDTIINSINFQIVTDEKTIRNASNSDVDSIFNAMVSRQRKGSLH
jgi:uncharacterized coiled-coil protein SlyX